MLPAIQPDMTIAEIKHRKAKIHELMRELMVEEHHFGIVPGTDKPTLLKPGAEMLCMTFRLMPSFSVTQRELAEGHREYRVDCDLTNAQGQIVAKGVGSCSTMESKYRWRLGSRKCPECQSDAIRKSKDGGGGFFCWAKLGGCGATFPEGDKKIVGQSLARVPNPDIADQWNTVLKMAAKRAHVHAVLLATAASDMFAPEGEDDDEHDDKPARSTAKKPQAAKKETAADPPREQTAKQKLMAECFAMHSELLKQGRSREGLTDLLGANGIIARTWGELDDATLQQVKTILGDELKLGQPVNPGKS
jgi:hypothetical protein